MAPSSEVLRRAGIDAPDMTERELAMLEGVSVRTLQQWRQLGTGPRYRKLGPGKKSPVRYPVEAIRSGGARRFRGAPPSSCTSES
jgi:hypothetical protein